jgi:nucleoside-diphosphate-sugar epimerase
VYRDGLENLIAAFAPKQVIFTGSTSVYDQQNGEVVDENSPTEPLRETARVLLEAEAVALRAGGIVARLGGIYGPGRSMFLRKFAEGSAVVEAGGERFINLIHREDAACALLRLADPQVPAGVYNVCDSHPPTQRELYGWISEFLGKPMPPDGPIDPHRKRGLNNKRVSNQKLLVTGWAPEFPSFREALPSLVREGF